MAMQKDFENHCYSLQHETKSEAELQMHRNTKRSAAQATTTTGSSDDKFLERVGLNFATKVNR
jgi:hypothetical protein